jgi:D-proline reductase (dithiol) PrdB
MATFAELPLSWRVFLQAYPWRRIDPVPWTPLRKPLAACRVALVSSAGFVAPGQPLFDDRVRGGDVSWRAIAADIDVRTLVETHRSDVFDHRGLQVDPNLAFPIDRLRELAVRGRIGGVNHRHVSIMGSITAPGRLVKRTAPEVAQALTADAVDVVLLVPV